MRIVSAVLVLLFVLGTALCRAQAPGSSFTVFDGLLYKGKPDLAGLGMRPIRGVNPPPGLPNNAPTIDADKVKRTLADAMDYEGAVYLDYETWPTFHASAAEVSQGIKILSQVADNAHQAAPRAKIGFYDVIPCWDYWGIVKGDLGKLQEWRACNIRIDELAQHVDIIMPSLYTFYNDQRSWDVYAAALLEASRRYKKPVYAFLWPEFHVSNHLLAGQNIPPAFWRHELEFVRTRADGIVIWGGWQKQWDEQSAWWVQTKEFLATLRASKN